MSDSAEDDLGIRPETIIDSTKAKYVANVMLGKVYKVHLEGDKSKEYAMKIEKKKATRKDSKLKMEIFILKNVAKLRQGKSHFTKIIDRGKKETYYFIVMDLVGKSLDDLKNSQPKRIFSLGTGLGFASQCLEATEDLHEQGCIHRDIKPENFAIGLGASKHIVYMLDFGIARKITKEDKELKTPRSAVGFKGTIRFASLACHKREEMGKKDDCESLFGWFYSLLDLLLAYGLPWKRIADKDLVKKSKEESRKEFTVEYDFMYAGLRKIRSELIKILSYVDSLSYVEKPDYDFIQKMLKEAAKTADVNMEPPYAWT